MDDRLHGDSRWRESTRSSFGARHFTAQVDERRGLYKFACESQPLMTLTSYGSPRRCPLCGTNYPIGKGKLTGGETSANQQR